VNATATEFWRQHPGLVWSNPAADDSVHIRAALLRPTFTRLLDIAVEFGLERTQNEWAELQGETTREVERAAPAVARIFTNLEKGFALAPRRH
jgi:hypothetical protein